MRPACANLVVSLSNHVHAPSVPGRRAGGATGTRVPHRQPGSWSPSSRRPLRASSESLAGSLGLTARGLPYGTRAGDFCPGAKTLASGAADRCRGVRHRTLSRKGGRRLRAIAGTSPETVASGPPGSRAIPLSFRAPAAATRTVNGPTHVPSQATVAAGCHTRQAAGISAVHRSCAHGESHHPSSPKPSTHPSSPKPRPCAEAIGDPAARAARASGFPLNAPLGGNDVHPPVNIPKPSTHPSSPKPRPCAEAIGDPAARASRASGFPLCAPRALCAPPARRGNDVSGEVFASPLASSLRHVEDMPPACRRGAMHGASFCRAVRSARGSSAQRHG